MRRTLRVTLVAALLVLVAALPASAGGWAVTSFEDAPGEFTAGETYELHYVILQHGETPIDVDSTAVNLRSMETGEVVTFEGRSAGEPGRYVVEISIPESGSWQWEVTQGEYGAQELGTLRTVPATGWIDWSATQVLRVLLAVATLAAVVVLVLQLAEFRRGGRAGSEPAAGVQAG